MDTAIVGLAPVSATMATWETRANSARRLILNLEGFAILNKSAPMIARMPVIVISSLGHVSAMTIEKEPTAQNQSVHGITNSVRIAMMMGALSAKKALVLMKQRRGDFSASLVIDLIHGVEIATPLLVRCVWIYCFYLFIDLGGGWRILLCPLMN